jgi:hypothetical protein
MVDIVIFLVVIVSVVGRLGDCDVGVAGAVGAAESVKKGHFGKGGEQPAVTNSKPSPLKSLKVPQKSKI